MRRYPNRVFATCFLCAGFLCCPGLVLAQDTDSQEEYQSTDESSDEALVEAALGELIVIEAAAAPRSTWQPSQRTVTQETLALTPHRSVDDLLRVVPGLHIAQHASEGKAQQFFVRGFDAVHGSDIAVSVGGLPVNEPSNVHGQGYVDIGFVLPEAVLSLSATKGSFDISQGDFATAGSIDFELGVEDSRRGQRASYELGSTNRQRALALFAPVDMPEATFLAIEGMSDQGFGSHRRSERMTVLGQHRIELSPERWVQGFASGYLSRFDEAGVVPVADYDAGSIGFYDSYNEAGEGRSQRALASLAFHDESDDHLFDSSIYVQQRRLSLAENFTGYLVNPELGDLKLQRHTVSTIGGNGSFERKLSKTMHLVLAGDTRADQIEQSEDQIDSQGNPWQRNRDLGASLAYGGLGAALRFRGMKNKFQAEVGGRFDAAWMRTEDGMSGGQGSGLLTNLSPRLAATYKIKQGWKAFAAYGHGIRSPEARSVTEMTTAGDAAGNPHFTTSRTGEAGLEGRMDGGLTLGATGFGTWISNELVFDHLTGANLARNASRRVGAEVRAELAITPWLMMRTDATAVSAQFVDSGAPVPGAPNFLARGEAQIIHPTGLRGGAQATAMAPRQLANGARGQGSAVVDLLASYRIGLFDIEVQVDNVFNSKLREGEFHYASRFDRNTPASAIPRLHYAAGRPLGVRTTLSMWF